VSWPPEIDLPAEGLLAAGKRFHKTLQVFVTIKEGFDEDPFVPSFSTVRVQA
jgi:hypothetical protein